MEIDGREYQIMRRATDNADTECQHEWLHYPSVGSPHLRIVKCRKCKLEAFSTGE